MLSYPANRRYVKSDMGQYCSAIPIIKKRKRDSASYWIKKKWLGHHSNEFSSYFHKHTYIHTHTYNYGIERNVLWNDS